MRAIHTIDATQVLVTLYPALMEHAEAELKAKGLPLHEAEDVVQTAARRWLEVIGTEAGARVYLRGCIRLRVLNLLREGRDAMTHHPLSLDAGPPED